MLSDDAVASGIKRKFLSRHRNILICWDDQCRRQSVV